MGRKLAAEVKQKMPMCNSPKVDAYLTKLGIRLVAQLNTNGIKYPWEFHCVNDKAINAFALPGGFVFVNRGAIEIGGQRSATGGGDGARTVARGAAPWDESGHQGAVHAQLGSGILGIAGGIVGGAAGAAAAGAGQLAFGSVLLKYSRGAETQADVMGTQVLYDAGYDPRAMAAFFENLNAQAAEKNPPEFFSDHPNPDHRIERVQEEIRNWAACQRVRRRIRRIRGDQEGSGEIAGAAKSDARGKARCRRNRLSSAGSGEGGNTFGELQVDCRPAKFR